MSTLLLLLLLIAGVATLGICVWIYQHIRTRPIIDPSLLLMLQQRIDNLSRDMTHTLEESHRQQLASSHSMTSAVRDVTERLVKIEETNKSVLSFSEQLEHLQRILTNPKQRGILGEYYLETLLRNIFSPEQYKMQYGFPDGTIVDAAVFVQKKIIPVDSKFSLENYNRLSDDLPLEDRQRLEKAFVNDLKQRILETSKYIRPQDGTMEFAFMFIPHEAIYYDLLLNRIGSATGDQENLLQRAASKYHVIIVSPTSFSAYLQTVLQGLNALKIEEQTREIRTRVYDLGRHLTAYEQYFVAVGKHLGTSMNQYNLASRELGKIDKDVLRITGQPTGMQPTVIDREEGSV